MSDEPFHLHPESVLADPENASITGRCLAGVVVVMAGCIAMSLGSVWLFLLGVVALVSGIVFVARPSILSATVAQCLLGFVIFALPFRSSTIWTREDVAPASRKWYFIGISVVLIVHAVFRVRASRVRVPPPSRPLPLLSSGAADSNSKRARQ